MKKACKIPIYGILVFGSIIAAAILGNSVSTWTGRTYNPLPAFVLFPIINIIIGAIFGLEWLINEREKQGRWKLQLDRLMILGIPALCLSLYVPIYFIGPSWVSILTGKLFLILDKARVFSIFQIFLGYILITSIVKREKTG